MNEPNANTDDIDSVRAWLHGWGGEVATQDFDRAEQRFDASVVGFGTKATIASGRSTLRSEQWQHVWPAIADFCFVADDASVWVSPDRLMAVLGAAWTSTGRSESGDEFPRNGRATVMVGRADVDAPWRGYHTHFSRDPDGPGTFTG
jgi:ketosteroid isomerase-like protein